MGFIWLKVAYDGMLFEHDNQPWVPEVQLIPKK